MLTTTSVPGSLHSGSMASATSAGLASPTASGTSSNADRHVCRKGSWTSRLCSPAWASSRSTHWGSDSSERRASSSRGTSPNGVSNAPMPLSARPRTGTKWLGPRSTTRRIPDGASPRARYAEAATGPEY